MLETMPLFPCDYFNGIDSSLRADSIRWPLACLLCDGTIQHDSQSNVHVD